MLEPFVLRAVAAAVALAAVSAPVGCIVVWSRMAYFGETVAQASLLGVAAGLALHLDMTASVLVVSGLAAGLVLLLSRQRLVPVDAVLGLLHNGALAAGVIAMSLTKGPPVDLIGYLFGDIFTVTARDLAWIGGGGALALAVLARLWPALVRIAVNEELAAAEGVDVGVTRLAFTLLIAAFIAVAIKIVGILLVIAFLIVPAVAARPLARTPETMALLTALIAAASAVAGIVLSTWLDVPGGPAIVLVMAACAAVTLATTARARG